MSVWCRDCQCWRTGRLGCRCPTVDHTGPEDTTITGAGTTHSEDCWEWHPLCAQQRYPTLLWLITEARDWAGYQRRLLSDAQWAMHGHEFPDTFPWEAQP